MAALRACYLTLHCLMPNIVPNYVGPEGPQTLCNACGVRWGRQLKASGIKKPQTKKVMTAGQKRRASPPSSRFNLAYIQSSDEEPQEDSSIVCPLPEDSGGASEHDFDCLAALNLMGMTMKAPPPPLAPSNPPGSLAIVPQELLNNILPRMSPQEVLSLKNHCQAYDEACIEAEAAEAAIRAVEQVLEQRREQARIKSEAMRFASETLFHETRKLSSLANVVHEHHYHHSSPRKCHSPKRSPF